MFPFRPVLAAAVCLLAAGPGVAATPAPPTDPSVDRMRTDIFFLAGPECEGRGVDTKGIEKAADYVAAAFKDAGLKPAFKDGAYFQPFTLTTGATLDGPNKLVFTASGRPPVDLSIPADASPMGFSRTGAAVGGVVFVGFGITAPKLGYDDYAGVDVAGKVVIVVRKTPKADRTGKDRWDTTAAEGEDSPHAALVSKVENAAAHKAAAVLFVSDRKGAGKNDDLFGFAAHAQGVPPAPFPVFHLKRHVADALLRGATGKTLAETEEAIDADGKPRSAALGGWTADAAVTVTRPELRVKNVVGVLDGAGPLADETVVIGAHYDHLGYGTFGSLGGEGAKGKVHYGADDNGSGTTGLLELARRFGAMKDRQGRRLVFAAFTGEERGLYGSIHYCKEPPFPLASTAAMLNMDMIGRVTEVPGDWLGVWGTKKDRMVIYGTGTGDSFAKLTDDLNGKFDFRLFKIPGGNAPTDSDTFYRKKVPVLFLFSGTHADYHKPTDTPDRINLAGMKKVVDLAGGYIGALSTGPRPAFVTTKGGWEDPTDPRPRARPGAKLGIMPGNYEEEDKGVLIGGVTPGGAADKAGLKEGDLIVEIGGKPVKNIGGYMTAMAGRKPGDPVDVRVVRKGKELTLSAVPQ